jgi:molybdopterin converting factor subunit 1
MKINIKTFASVSDICGFKEREITIDTGSTVSDAVAMLVKNFNSLEKLSDKLLFAVNEEYCDKLRILNENDILAIFPQVSGG